MLAVQQQGNDQKDLHYQARRCGHCKDMASVNSSELMAKLEDLNLILKMRRLCWYGHVERSSGAVRMACDIDIDGTRWPVRLAMMLKTWKHMSIVRSAMPAASQLHGVGLLMWMMLLHLYVHQKSNDADDVLEC